MSTILDWNAFIDRVVEHPGRVEIDPVSGAGWTTADITDGVLTLDDVSGDAFVADISREEGTVTEAGTALTADNMHENIEGMIVEMINSVYFSSFDVLAGSSGSLIHRTGYCYLVFWRSSGNSGSFGIDYLTISSGTISAREMLLSSGGTHLPSYSYSNDRLWIENTATSTTIVCTVLRHLH